jgi:hypothetical protein
MPSLLRLARNAIACAFLALALSACVLSAREPIYSDADAKLIFATPEVTLIAYSLKNDQWEAEKETMVLKAQGQHYTAKIEKSDAEITFVPLDGSWYVVQSIEAKKAPFYTLLRDDSGELHVFPVSCDAVKKIGTSGDHVELVKDGCYLKPGVDHKPLFLELTANPGADTLKLVPKS